MPVATGLGEIPEELRFWARETKTEAVVFTKRAILDAAERENSRVNPDFEQQLKGLSD
ncbi:hypothetical protein [Yoonia sp.]|uniref:hypothetical protein n=1 Tax=Yoonia sp. TaxID=2212373 RepID=UPI0032656C5C